MDGMVILETLGFSFEVIVEELEQLAVQSESSQSTPREWTDVEKVVIPGTKNQLVTANGVIHKAFDRAIGIGAL